MQSLALLDWWGPAPAAPAMPRLHGPAAHALRTCASLKSWSVYHGHSKDVASKGYGYKLFGPSKGVQWRSLSSVVASSQGNPFEGASTFTP